MGAPFVIGTEVLRGPATPERLQQLASAAAFNESLGRAKKIIVPLNDGGTGLPFYCVHSLSGKATDFIPLARMLGCEQPLFAIQMPAANRDARFGGALSPVSLQTVAAHYVEALVAFQPQGPLALGGWSVGTLIALEMAQQLKAQGRDVRLLVAMDMAPWNSGADLGNLSYRAAQARNALPWFFHHRLLHQPSLVWQRLLQKAGAAIPSGEPDAEGFPKFLVEEFIAAAKYPPAHLELMQNILDMAVRYVSRRYDGKVQLYVARSEVAFSHFPKMTAEWRAAAADVAVMRVPGAHKSMIEDGTGLMLARHLRKLLGALR